MSSNEKRMTEKQLRKWEDDFELAVNDEVADAFHDDDE